MKCRKVIDKKRRPYGRLDFALKSNSPNDVSKPYYWLTLRSLPVIC
jgi:hypothetical protein